ncbi:hypothetical protein C8Q74DRAFT_587327 [Fomes fomentarius]|nr:hypothetical protein C8Q74DRAFT_587327 [Fomes fomentarius]
MAAHYSRARTHARSVSGNVVRCARGDDHACDVHTQLELGRMPGHRGARGLDWLPRVYSPSALADSAFVLHIGVIFAVSEPPAGCSRGRLANAERGSVPEANEQLQSAGTGNLQEQERRRGPVPANLDDLTIPSARALEVLPSLRLDSVFSALLPRLQSCPPRTPLPHRDSSRMQARPMQRPQLSTCAAAPRRAHHSPCAHTVGLRWVV